MRLDPFHNWVLCKCRNLSKQSNKTWKIFHIVLSQSKFIYSLCYRFSHRNLGYSPFYAGNQLTGSIPSSFMNLTKLTRVDLSRNKLSGTIDFTAFAGSRTTLISMYASCTSFNLFLNNDKFSALIWDCFSCYFGCFRLH